MTLVDWVAPVRPMLEMLAGSWGPGWRGVVSPWSAVWPEVSTRQRIAARWSRSVARLPC